MNVVCPYDVPELKMDLSGTRSPAQKQRAAFGALLKTNATSCWVADDHRA